MGISDNLNDYRHVRWGAMAKAIAGKLGNPDLAGLLDAVRTSGERTDNDKVSSAGARTVYQIIPATRDASIKKWGVDPYASDYAATLTAAHLLQDSLSRNGGDVDQAVGEYHGGTNRENWGRVNRAYRGRVLGALGLDSPDAGEDGVDHAPSRRKSKDPAAALVGASPTAIWDAVAAAGAGADDKPISMAKIHDAYTAGRMSDQEAQDYEAAVKSGRVILPSGSTLKNDAPKGANDSAALDLDKIHAAYQSGAMKYGEARDYENAVDRGLIKLKPGQELHPPGFLSNLWEQLSGSQRATDDTRNLPQWTSSPELNSMSLASLKTALGTMMAKPDEAAAIIKQQFPKSEFRQDENGNQIFRSGEDGKEYAIPPGVAMGDLPRIAGGLLAFTPAGRAETIAGGALASGATQGAVEATQAATGGSFDPGEVVGSAVAGGGVPLAGRVLKPVAGAANEALGRALGRAPAAGAGGASSTVPAMTAEQLGATARSAARGSETARIQLAEQATPDAETVAAADRLGIGDHLQPDHVTTNQGYQALARVVKSQQGSAARTAERQGLSRAAQRADQIISDMGGADGLDAVSNDVRDSLTKAHADLGAQASSGFATVAKAIPAGTRADAPKTLAVLQDAATEAGGAQLLPAGEQRLLSTLGRTGGQPATFDFLDRARRMIGQALDTGEGSFKDSGDGMLRKLREAIHDDQHAIADAHGAGDTFAAARALHTTQQGIGSDLASLFGKHLTDSLAPELTDAVAAATRGNAARLAKVLRATPDPLKGRVVLSGLRSALGMATSGGEVTFRRLARFFDGLDRSPQAKAMVMTHLPPETRVRLADLARVAKSVTAATGESATGAVGQTIKGQLTAADSLVRRFYDVAKARAVRAPVAWASGHILGHGAGLAVAVASILTRSAAKPEAIRAADAILSAPEFAALVKVAGSGGPVAGAAARRLAATRAFSRYAKSVGAPQAMSQREKWILHGLQQYHNRT